MLTPADRIQGVWTAQGATEEMRQISEVVAYISQGDTGTNLLNVGGMVECFGTMLHSCALEEEMEKAMMPVSKDVHDSEALESAPTCIVEGLDMVLSTRVKQGEGIVITTARHTTYMYRCDAVAGSLAGADAWYLFDPMDGSLDFVSTGGGGGDRFGGAWEAAYRHRYAGGPSAGHHKGDAEYTAMIFGKPKEIKMPVANMPGEHAVGLAPGAPRLHPHQSFCVPFCASVPSLAKRRNEIMGKASRVLSDMEIRGGDDLDASYHVSGDAGGDVGGDAGGDAVTGGVVQMLRDGKNHAKLSVAGTRVTGKRIRGGGYDLDEETPSILVWQ